MSVKIRSKSRICKNNHIESCFNNIIKEIERNNAEFEWEYIDSKIIPNYTDNKIDSETYIVTIIYRIIDNPSDFGMVYGKIQNDMPCITPTPITPLYDKYSTGGNYYTGNITGDKKSVVDDFNLGDLEI